MSDQEAPYDRGEIIWPGPSDGGDPSEPCRSADGTLYSYRVGDAAKGFYPGGFALSKNMPNMYRKCFPESLATCYYFNAGVPQNMHILGNCMVARAMRLFGPDASSRKNARRFTDAEWRTIDLEWRPKFRRFTWDTDDGAPRLICEDGDPDCGGGPVEPYLRRGRL